MEVSQQDLELLWTEIRALRKDMKGLRRDLNNHGRSLCSLEEWREIKDVLARSRMERIWRLVEIPLAAIVGALATKLIF